MPAPAGATAPTLRSIRSSRSAWSCRAARTTSRRRSRSRARRACRCCRAAAAPRNAARRSARALVIDYSKHWTGSSRSTREARTVAVEPGHRARRAQRAAQAARAVVPGRCFDRRAATLGGMAGNNSCGSRSIRYGNMVHNVRAIDAMLADGSERAVRRASRPARAQRAGAAHRGADREPSRLREARRDRARASRSCCAASAATTSTCSIRMRAALHADGRNLAHLLVGSEGTLAFSQRIKLDAAADPASTRCSASATSRPSTRRWRRRSTSSSSAPSAVELVDRTMIELAREIPRSAPTVDAFVQRRARRAAAGRIRRRRRDEQLATLARARRADGRSRPPRQRGRGDRRRASSAMSGRCARPASTS